MEGHRNTWLAVMTILAAMGIALVAAAIAAGTQEQHFHFWRSSEMHAAYVCFGLAFYVLLATMYEWPLFGARRRHRRLSRLLAQMSRGSVLHRRCLANEDKNELTTAYQNWFTETAGVLKDVAPLFLVEFQLPVGAIAFYYNGVSHDASEVAVVIERKLEGLRRAPDWLRA